MSSYSPFGLQYTIELDAGQTIKLQEVVRFSQYGGHTVRGIYEFIEMDPWNEDIFDLFENEIGGTELDTLQQDLKDLSYQGKRHLLESDPDLKREYENGEIGESEISEGFAFDLVWESQSEDAEWQERYVAHLENLLIENPKASKNTKVMLQSLVENAKSLFQEFIVVMVYKITAK